MDTIDATRLFPQGELHGARHKANPPTGTGYTGRAARVHESLVDHISQRWMTEDDARFCDVPQRVDHTHVEELMKEIESLQAHLDTMRSALETNNLELKHKNLELEAKKQEVHQWKTEYQNARTENARLERLLSENGYGTGPNASRASGVADHYDSRELQGPSELVPVDQSRTPRGRLTPSARITTSPEGQCIYMPATSRRARIGESPAAGVTRRLSPRVTRRQSPAYAERSAGETPDTPLYAFRPETPVAVVRRISPAPLVYGPPSHVFVQTVHAPYPAPAYAFAAPSAPSTPHFAYRDATPPATLKNPDVSGETPASPRLAAKSNLTPSPQMGARNVSPQMGARNVTPSPQMEKRRSPRLAPRS